MRMSSPPPPTDEDRDLVSAPTADAMDSVDVTSRVSVSMPCEASGESLAGFRAVAYTRWPAAWKTSASAAPIPPGEHPVIKTVSFRGEAMADGWEEGDQRVNANF